MIKYSLIISLCVIFLFSCKEERKKKTYSEVMEYKESLVEVNKYLVKKDAETIANYINRKRWDMQETETGLWYKILQKGTGSKAEKGKIAVIDYEIYLLDGRACYSSDSLGAKEFKISFGNVESGLEQGILLLREGDRARFIIPPHLAHGLLGDGFMIPPRTIIVYELNLLKLFDN